MDHESRVATSGHAPSPLALRSRIVAIYEMPLGPMLVDIPGVMEGFFGEFFHFDCPAVKLDATAS